MCSGCSVGAEGRAQIFADYRGHLQDLESLQPLVLPSLDDFDDQRMPLAR